MMAAMYSGSTLIPKTQGDVTPVASIPASRRYSS